MGTEPIVRYLRVIALITLGFGLALLFFPNFSAHLFFDNLTVSSQFFIRICGSTLLGYSALNWLAARSADKAVYKVTAWSNLVTLVIATFISLAAIPDFDKNVWILPLQHALFAGGFVYCLIKLK